MLAASVVTNGSAISMKDVSQPLQLPTCANRGLSTTSSVYTSSSTPPVTVTSGTAVQQTSTEAANTVVRRSGRERDSSWLELEACREHLRQTCPRPADECRYAHPEPRIYVKDGRVTCCYDYLKDRCYRERCRYFHPPDHIKDCLVTAGRQFGAMMSNLHVAPGAGVNSSQFPTANSFSHLNAAPMPLMTQVIYSPDGRIMSAAPPGFIPGTPYGVGTERIDVCPYFARGQNGCTNPVCPMLHPEPHIRVNLDATVTVCRDYVRGICSHEKCRYYHPPGNILDSGAMPAMLQQGIMVASPVMPVYPPMMYPGPVTSLPSPVGSGVPLYPSVPAVPVPLVLASPLPPPPPPPISMTQHFNNAPISKITSSVQGPGPSLDEDSELPVVMAQYQN